MADPARDQNKLWGVIPGGHFPDRLRLNKKAVSSVQSLVSGGKPVFGIRHGPRLLIKAGIVPGQGSPEKTLRIHKVRYENI
jgi:phosphoribosylformylglycinamidine (FGAM) synthase-like amidotransferase family enzyme